MANNSHVLFVLGTATPSECADFILSVLLDICLKIGSVLCGAFIAMILLYCIIVPKDGTTAVKKVEKCRFGSLSLLREQEEQERKRMNAFSMKLF